MDGDPLLTERLAFPCPGDEFADAVRRFNRPLLILDPRKRQTAKGQVIGQAELDSVADLLGNNVQYKGEMPSWADNRIFYCCWKGAADNGCSQKTKRPARATSRMNCASGEKIEKKHATSSNRSGPQGQGCRSARGVSLPAEAGTPLAHYRKTSTDLWNSILYIERAFSQPGLYRDAAERRLGRINGMVLMNLIENFERLLKETAATCVDRLANYVLDDRLNVFAIQGSGLASHFGTATLGKSLCESGTWLNCEEIDVGSESCSRTVPTRRKFPPIPKADQQPVDERGGFQCWD